ncbi:MAG: AbrB/MazE/SpoVT family DNA-binding domain-containing protein [Chloroflexota bacterium]
MTQKVGAKGQVVIPKEIRDLVGLHPGTEVDVEAEGSQVVVKVHRPRRRLGGRFQQSGMAARLLQEREAEPR